MIATAKDVRAWARKNGISVGDRGTIQAQLWEMYLEHHPEASN